MPTLGLILSLPGFRMVALWWPSHFAGIMESDRQAMPAAGGAIAKS
ncbi:hypothetical protein VB713_20470 [Anabaena cylindrica UHCC 0172]|nr:hypothetical protein [Anabaena cylindrica]MEA5553317.1 hypothetical protein [Anabaena cylindrica UHCC 0172]